jgi:hypothetical protein
MRVLLSPHSVHQSHIIQSGVDICIALRQTAAYGGKAINVETEKHMPAFERFIIRYSLFDIRYSLLLFSLPPTRRLPDTARYLAPSSRDRQKPMQSRISAIPRRPCGRFYLPTPFISHILFNPVCGCARSSKTFNMHLTGLDWTLYQI